ncbi:flagellar biosynthetic protein FliO [Planomonospora sp. ID82291]|uniref:flagellar biosynthetic protein FliO n=1 Tax=Planomonospora sp. ID82291 TaxID=2738136 RepID=UPI0018C41726|nr:flagellar biosynthetic protein FliO [Planomonospora sp. ID82291]MBG0818494.1 flagellar biosynthetic protein FliO [Planomonospora sp. ID82291]
MFETVLRITFSLLVVLLLVWGLSKAARKPLAGRGGGLLTVVARQQLTRNSSVAVVRVTDRALVLGVTDGQVTLLAEADLEAVERYGEHSGQRIPVSLPAVLPSADSSPADAGTAGQGPGALAGSALSPRTWKTALEILRERTARN